MEERLWPDGPLFSGSPGVFPLGTDSMVLADFARPGKSCRILDLGAGSGILTLLLLHGHPNRRAVSVDISEIACETARRNLAANGLSGQGEVLLGDFARYRDILPPGGFDYVISNPPYFPAGSGKAAAGGLENARGDGTGSIADVCRAAGWALRWGGDVSLCFRPERLADLICALREAGLEPKRLRLMRHHNTSPVNLVLLEARRGGKPGLSWEPELYLYDELGRKTAEYRRIYHL